MARVKGKTKLSGRPKFNLDLQLWSKMQRSRKSGIGKTETWTKVSVSGDRRGAYVTGFSFKQHTMLVSKDICEPCQSHLYQGGMSGRSLFLFACTVWLVESCQSCPMRLMDEKSSRPCMSSQDECKQARIMCTPLILPWYRWLWTLLYSMHMVQQMLHVEAVSENILNTHHSYSLFLTY